MNVTYTVHSATTDPVQTQAKLADGSVVDATVEGFTVELVSDSGLMSTVLRFLPPDAMKAADLFKPGSKVVASYSPASAPAPAAAEPAQPE